MEKQRRSAYRVTLVVPPFRTVVRPALGVSLLQAALRKNGFECCTLYTNLKLADSMGVHLYETMADQGNLAPGDFLFSCALFNRTRVDIERYVDEVLMESRKGRLYGRTGRAYVVHTMTELAKIATSFIDDAVTDILETKPQLVGLTSSYQENLASMALIRRIKQRAPEVQTIVGGANCGGDMGGELLTQFPELDFVGQGECDRSLVDLVTGLVAGDGRNPVPGILSRRPDSNSDYRTISAEELDQMPFPDFDDYFEQIAELPWRRRFVAGLVMESSRGCWWGAKHRCSFCGLNAEQYHFRSKSPQRFRAELASLVEKFNIRRVEMVDNIVDPRYYREVFPAMATTAPPVEQFWETSGSLTRNHVQALAEAGTTYIQAGIESLSEHALRLMNKPTSAIHNVQTLKWCAEWGIGVRWNHLFGIPEETEEDLNEISRIASALHHLYPPGTANPIALQRFSPYFESSVEHGFGEAHPRPQYRYLYPFADDSLTRVAFFFESEFTRAKLASAGHRKLRKVVSQWRKAHWRSHLVAAEGKRRLVVIDTRHCAVRHITRLTGTERRVFELCDSARDIASIVKAGNSELKQQEVEAALRFLVERRLMLHIEGRYLSLATYIGRGRRVAIKETAENTPGGHVRPICVADVWAAWRRRTAFRWILAAYLNKKMHRATDWWKGRLASRLMTGCVRSTARLLAGPQ